MRLHHNLEQGTAEHRLLCDVYCDNPWVDLCNINTLWRRLSKRKRKLFPDFRPVTGEKISNLNRRIWRFLPLLDPWSDIVLTRDIDALITNREIAALDQWLASNFTFHVMRDHQGHKAHILAGIHIIFLFTARTKSWLNLVLGLFGVKVKQRRDLIEGLTRVLINFGQNQKYDTDQIILSKVFWPSVKHDVVRSVEKNLQLCDQIFYGNSRWLTIVTIAWRIGTHSQRTPFQHNELMGPSFRITLKVTG